MRERIKYKGEIFIKDSSSSPKRVKYRGMTFVKDDITDLPIALGSKAINAGGQLIKILNAMESTPSSKRAIQAARALGNTLGNYGKAGNASKLKKALADTGKAVLAVLEEGKGDYRGAGSLMNTFSALRSAVEAILRY